MILNLYYSIARSFAEGVVSKNTVYCADCGRSIRADEDYFPCHCVLAPFSERKVSVDFCSSCFLKRFEISVRNEEHPVIGNTIKTLLEKRAEKLMTIFSLIVHRYQQGYAFDNNFFKLIEYAKRIYNASDEQEIRDLASELEPFWN